MLYIGQVILMILYWLVAKLRNFVTFFVYQVYTNTNISECQILKSKKSITLPYDNNLNTKISRENKQLNQGCVQQVGGAFVIRPSN